MGFADLCVLKEIPCSVLIEQIEHRLDLFLSCSHFGGSDKLEMLSGSICQCFREDHCARCEGREELKTALFSKSYVTHQGGFNTKAWPVPAGYGEAGASCRPVMLRVNTTHWKAGADSTENLKVTQCFMLPPGIPGSQTQGNNEDLGRSPMHGAAHHVLPQQHAKQNHQDIFQNTPNKK